MQISIRSIAIGMFSLAAILPLVPAEAVAGGATVRSDLLPARPDLPDYTVVRHVIFTWGNFANASVSTVAYYSYDAAQLAARALAELACDRDGVDQVIVTGTLFLQPERKRCTSTSDAAIE